MQVPITCATPVLLAQSAYELMQSARSHQSNGILLGQLAMLVFAGLFLYAAVTTVRNGLRSRARKNLPAFQPM